MESQEAVNHAGFLKVRGRCDTKEDAKKYVKKLASATFQCLTNHGHCEMRCVGRDAVYNAVKALIIANGYCAQRGAEIMFTPSFDEGNLGDLKEGNHVQDVTAIKFSVKDYNTEKMSELKGE